MPALLPLHGEEATEDEDRFRRSGEVGEGGAPGTGIRVDALASEKAGGGSLRCSGTTRGLEAMREYGGSVGRWVGDSSCLTKRRRGDCVLGGVIREGWYSSYEFGGGGWSLIERALVCHDRIY